MNVMQSLADFKQSLHPAHPAAAAAAVPASSSSSASDSTTITANDFLQLLVAEMKNQDPTADQDPNAYIDQLVQVNSLQQLIAINQDLSGVATAGSTTGSTTGSTASSPATGAADAANPAAHPNAHPTHPARQQLGTAGGTPAARVATALAPRPLQPDRAPVAGTQPAQGLLPAIPPVVQPSPATGVGLGSVVSRLLGFLHP